MDDSASFGAWLRRRRKALDITQAELAHGAGCVVGTIRSIEGEVRRPSRQLAARLADCLKLEQAEREAFIRAARKQLGADQLPLASAPIATGSAESPRTSSEHWPAGTTQRLA